MSINWRSLDHDAFLALIPTEERAFDLAQRLGLVDTEKKCSCGRPMRLQANQQRNHGCQFVCTASRSICMARRSVLSDSFFSRTKVCFRAKTKVPIRTALKCISAFAGGLRNHQFPYYVGIRSPSAIVDWKRYCRDICAAVIRESSAEKIGGPNCTVEIDESLIYKRKNHVGRLLVGEASQSWVFGGICRETSEAFVVPVPDRRAVTLLAVLQEHVLSGTRVISDCWRAYSDLSRQGFDHAAVNHSLNFVDPDDPTVNTQRVERMWRTLKSVIPAGTSQELRWTYLAEFVFKQRTRWYSKTIGERIELLFNNMKMIRFD